jgi:hypothetical protein
MRACSLNCLSKQLLFIERITCEFLKSMRKVPFRKSARLGRLGRLLAGSSDADKWAWSVKADRRHNPITGRMVERISAILAKVLFQKKMNAVMQYHA